MYHLLKVLSCRVFTTDLYNITKCNRCHAEVHYFLLIVHYLLTHYMCNSNSESVIIINSHANQTEAYIKMQFHIKTCRSKSKVLTQWHLNHTPDEQKKTEKRNVCMRWTINFTQLPNFRREESGRCVRKEEVKSFRSNKRCTVGVSVANGPLTFPPTKCTFFQFAKNNYQKLNCYTCFHTATPFIFILSISPYVLHFDLVTRT